MPALTTATRLPTPGPGGRDPGQDGYVPVICLCYAHSGVARLRPLLERLGIVCTQGSGLLPVCQQAARTWAAVENRDGACSRLAGASIRAMVGAMSALVMASEGGTRWCEIALAQPAAIAAYLEVFPSARFLCLHRNCLDVIRSAALAYPFGLAGSPFDRFATGHGGTAAAVAAYWHEHTAALLRVEDDRPGACLRLRDEDLAGDPAAADRIAAFLGTGGPPLPAIPGPAQVPSRTPDPALAVLVEQIPAQLSSQIDELQARLRYPPLSGA